MKGGGTEEKEGEGNLTSCPWQPHGSPYRTCAAGSARKTRTAEQGGQMVEVQWSTNPTKYGQRYLWKPMNKQHQRF